MLPSDGGSRPPNTDLSLALQRLTGEAHRFWSDPAHRERLLRDILDIRGREARARALQAVDDGVTEGMAALGFPRAPIRSISLVTPSRPGIAGQKYSTCDLQIAYPVLKRELDSGGSPDAIVETWIHESVHGRHVNWGPNLHAEAAFRGFEEGLAEGITRLASRLARFVPGLPTYGRFVQAYEELAFVLRVSPETIYRRLYRLPNGSVMDAFISEIDAIRLGTGEPPLTTNQRARLEITARRLFARRHAEDTASSQWQASIRQAWRRAVR